MKSDFALLDVKAGRAELARRIERGEKIPVTVRGTISAQWGNDDGTSIEFQVDVTSVTERKR